MPGIKRSGTEEFEELYDKKVKAFEEAVDIFAEAFRKANRLAELEMEAPEKVRPIAIDDVFPSVNFIYFWTDKEIAESLKQYGTVEKAGSKNDYWLLTVDGRYDFNAVISWLRELEEVFDESR